MQLEKIDNDKLETIGIQWMGLLEALPMINPARYLGAISRARNTLLDGGRDQHAYAYVGTGGTYDGIVLLSHACPKSDRSWLKMLELTLAPNFADPNNPPPLKDLFEIGGVVLTEVFELSSDILRSKSVKIYGDSIMEARIWREIANPSILPENTKLPFDVSSHGAWLVLKRH